MKKYIFTTLAITLMASCTPETEVLKELRKENPVAPSIKDKSPLDLTKTQAVFSPDEVSKVVARNADTKEIVETSFTFAPKLIRRQLATGEILKLKVEQSTSQYEVALPQEAYTLEKAEVSSDQANDVFKVTLNKEGCKALEANKEYVLRLKLSVSAKTPESLPVEVKDAFYKIKVKVLELASLPNGGDNIEISKSSNEVIPTGTSLINYKDIKAEYSGDVWGNIETIINGQANSGTYINVESDENALTFKFKELKKIKAVTFYLKMSSYMTSTMRAFGFDGLANDFVEQGFAQFTDLGGGYYTIKFKESLITNQLKFNNFEHNYIYIGEVYFYEEK